MTEEPPKINSVKYTQADIQIDSSTVEAKTFSKNFKKKYTDQDFIYEQKAPEKSYWDRFKDWLASILRSIFSFNYNRSFIKIHRSFSKNSCCFGNCFSDLFNC